MIIARLTYGRFSSLGEKLKLELHPDKVFLKTSVSGVDFLGWINFVNHRVLRTTTKKRMFKNLERSGNKPEMLQSYLEMLCRGNGWKLRNRLRQNRQF